MGPLTDLFFEDALVGRCLVAPDGSILRANSEWLRWSASGVDDVIGRQLVGWFPQLPGITADLLARACAGHHVAIPLHVRQVGGRQTWWEGGIDPVPLSGGTGLLITTREIRTEFQLFYESAPVSSLVLAPDAPRFTIVAASDAYLRATRTSRNIIGRGIFEVFPDDPNDPASTGAPARASFERVLATGLPDGMAVQKHSIRSPEAEGGFEERYWSPSNTPVLGDGGEVLYIHHRVEDVTEFVRARANGAEQQSSMEQLRTRMGEMEADVIRRGQELQDVNHQLRAANDRLAALDRERERHAQERVRQGTALLNAISDTSPDAIYAKDGAGRIQLANPATLALIGKPLAQVLGRTDAEFLDDAQAARKVMENDRRIMESGVPEELEEHVPLPDGSQRVWLSRKSPWRDLDGTVIGLLGISTDITQRKRTEEALRERKERLQSVLENMSEGIMVFDGNGDTLYQNPAALRIHGVTEESGRFKREELPATWRGWAADGTPLPFDQWPLARVLRSERFQNQVMHAERVETGHTFDASYNGCPIRGANGTLVYGFITIREITEQVRAEKERERVAEALRRAYEQLREADRRKDEFLGMLSHELRNPLAPIRNSIYILNRAAPGSEQAQRARTVIQRQTDHLTRLVDDLLDVTRIARGKIELRRQHFDLGEVASRSAEDLRGVLAAQSIELAVDIPADPILVDGDPARLTQVIGNLLQNAGKFTRAGGAVSIALRRTAANAELRVRDTGVGIEPALLPHVFEAFVQGEQSLARSQGGLGLGLAHVKAIVELHCGTANAYSEGAERGAEFVIELPLAAHRVEPEAAARRQTSARGRRVLVVEDNQDAAESLAQIVELMGHTADVAHDGVSAVEMATQGRYDVILCDIGLPLMDGYEVARAVRTRGVKGTRLIAVSGYAQPEDVARAVQAGFDGHVAKPPDPDKIAVLIS